jgi:hypothetical protein
MFSLIPSPEEIKKALETLEMMEHHPIKLNILTGSVYWKRDEISKRKTRLCIAALREKGHLIIATNSGYMLAGDDPTDVIHFINGLYSRAHKLTKEADIMFHGVKQKYGGTFTSRVQQLPGQPVLLSEITQVDIDAQHDRMNGEPAFQKTYDSDGTLHNV